MNWYENSPSHWGPLVGATWMKNEVEPRRRSGWATLLRWQKSLVDWYGYKNLVKWQASAGRVDRLERVPDRQAGDELRR